MIESSALIATGLFPQLVIEILLVAGLLGFVVSFLRKNS